MCVNLVKRQRLDSAQFRGFKTSFIRCYIWRRQILNTDTYRHEQFPLCSLPERLLKRSWE